MAGKATSNPTLRMQLQPVFHCSSLNAIDPGSGREILAICHGTPAFGMVILPQNPSTGNGQVPGWSCILSVDTLESLIFEYPEEGRSGFRCRTVFGYR